MSTRRDAFKVVDEILDITTDMKEAREFHLNLQKIQSDCVKWTAPECKQYKMWSMLAELIIISFTTQDMDTTPWIQRVMTIYNPTYARRHFPQPAPSSVH